MSDFVRRAARRDNHPALGIDAGRHEGHLRPAVLLADSDAGTVVLLKKFLCVSDLHACSSQTSSTMTVGAPETTVDPKLGQLESVGICLSLGVEGGAASAEDGNSFCLFGVNEHDGRARRPLARFSLLGLHLYPMVAVGFGMHDFGRMKDKG